jgi:hypothetical protein
MEGHPKGTSEPSRSLILRNDLEGSRNFRLIPPASQCVSERASEKIPNSPCPACVCLPEQNRM